MRLLSYLLVFGGGLLAGVACWEGPRAWMVWRAHVRRTADAVAPHAGAGLARAGASLTDGTRLISAFAVALLLGLAAVVALLTWAVITPDEVRRRRLARWVTAGLGVLLGALGAFYGRVLW